MRKILLGRLERARIGHGPYASTYKDGGYGLFVLMGPCAAELTILSSEGDLNDISEGWEHVSVSTPRRCPNWQEMCFVKNLFWHEEECVVQFHPPQSEWINNHRFVLHLWKHKTKEFPRPPSILVGVKELGEL